MMMEEKCETGYEKGALVERNIDGMWFEAVITGVTDSALFTCYSLRYTDDNKTEDDVDENDLRLQVDHNTIEDQVINHADICDDRMQEVPQHRPCSLRHWSADDVMLLPRWAKQTSPPVYLHSNADIANSSTVTSTPLGSSVESLPVSSSRSVSRIRHRRWSFESAPLATSNMTVANPMGGAVTKKEQSEDTKLKRQQRFENEDHRVFIPLAARCANPSCRQFTIYRCQRCNQSYSCRVACQKEVWNAGHSEECRPTPFSPMFIPPVTSPSAPVTAVAVSVQNDWLADDFGGTISVTGSRIGPQPNTVGGGTGSKSMTELDELCANINLSTIFDHDSSKSIYNNTSTATASTTTTTTTATTTFNPIRNSGSSSVLEQVPEVEEHTESEEFTQKVNQLSEAFSRPSIEVSRVLRYFANDEDAAVECLIMGQSKTEEEVEEEVLRLARNRESARLQAAGGAAVVAPPAYSHSMLDIDDEPTAAASNAGTGSSKSVSVGVGAGSSEDWSHLYTHLKSLDETDEDEMPPLIETEDYLPRPPAPPSSSYKINMEETDRHKDEEKDSDSKNTESEGWWQDIDQQREWSCLEPNSTNANQTDHNPNELGKPLDDLDSRSTSFAPVGSKSLLYFIPHPEQMSLPRPMATTVDVMYGHKSAIIFQGPVFLGKRATIMTVSCVIKSGHGLPSVEQINVEIEPRDNIEALLIETKKKSNVSSSYFALAEEEYQERLIDVDVPLRDLLVMLATPPSLSSAATTATPSNEPEDEPPITSSSQKTHVHEMNFVLGAAIDLLVLYHQHEQLLWRQDTGEDEVVEGGMSGGDSLSIREKMDACFWHVAAMANRSSQETFASSSRKRSGSVEQLDQERRDVGVLEPHALGVVLVKALLLHMRTGLLNPFSSDSNSFFHASSEGQKPRENSENEGGGGKYMQYILLAYQVRYVSPSNEDVDTDNLSSKELHIVQSDCAERVMICKQEQCNLMDKANGEGNISCDNQDGDVEQEDDYEEQVQELVDILMVDRDTARSALVVNNGDMNQSMEWLLSKLDQY